MGGKEPGSPGAPEARVGAVRAKLAEKKRRKLPICVLPNLLSALAWALLQELDGIKGSVENRMDGGRGWLSFRLPEP